MNDQQMENKRKHLDLIQGVINRLAHNSFLIKGWMITVAIAGTGVALNEKMKPLIIMTLASVFLFWFLDGYYLRLEKLFRAHFDFVAASDEDLRFVMDISKYQKVVPNIWSIMISIPTLVLYLPLSLLIAAMSFCCSMPK